MHPNLDNKRIFVAIQSCDDLLEIDQCIEANYINNIILVIDPNNIELWKLLTDNYRPVCSARNVMSDGQVLELINKKYAFVMSTNTNIHILSERIITPCVNYDEAITKAEHGAKNILWFGDEDGAINIKKIGSNVIVYVNDYKKVDDWDFVDGFWFSYDDEFKKQVKGF